MRKTESLLLLSAFVFACDPADDGTSSAEEGAGEAGSSTSSEEEGSTGEETGTGSGPGESSSGAQETGTSGTESAEGQESTGDGIDPCEDCDPATSYCHVSIADGPSEYSCRELPPECLDDISCECLAEVVCSEGSNSCEPDPVPGEVVSVDCWEG